MLGRQFNKVFRRMNRKSKPYVKNIVPDISKSNELQRHAKAEEEFIHGKGVKRFGCGHVKVLDTLDQNVPPISRI